jgi:asparagine synthase (glutamine-hydrolysing)
MVRCAHYQDRPSNADQLHVDLWWRGINVACDAGTYLYHAERPWDNGLSTTNVHNTVTVDGHDQMRRHSRFLWLDWARGRVLHHTHSRAGHLEYWEGMHDGYQRFAAPVTHQRGIVRLGSEHWLILDALHSNGEHDYTLHWLLPDLSYRWDETLGTLALNTPHGPYQVQIITPGVTGQFSLICAGENSIRGWHSRYYAYKEPALSLNLTLRNRTAQFLTLVGPAAASLQASESEISIRWEGWETLIILDEHRSLVRTVVLNGDLEDRLEVQE